ncbi:MAG: Fic family protein [Candidatus Diapherotrites archaeon]
MSLRKKKVKGEKYYYLHLSYRVLDKPKSFSKYVGIKKPSKRKLARLENEFKSELVKNLFGKEYSNEIISKDDLIKAALFRDRFYKKYNAMSSVKRRKYDVDSTILFTLTTLTTEDVDVDLQDVKNALEKHGGLNVREKISKNMLQAVDFIRKKKSLDEKYLLKLHAVAMSQFETKTPGKLRNRRVYIYKQDHKNPAGVEIAFKPPSPEKIPALFREFVEWYHFTDLNPLEKAFVAHTKIYMIHPFLDGNKRICRLILNKTLIDSNFPLLNISAKKEEYFKGLIRGAETGKYKAFVEFSLQEYFRQVKEFLKVK